MPANLAAHTRLLAHQHELAPMPDTGDLVWLATEYTHADLVHHGVAAARYTATDALHHAEINLDTGGIDGITGSGHPHAAQSRYNDSRSHCPGNAGAGY